MSLLFLDSIYGVEKKVEYKWDIHGSVEKALPYSWTVYEVVEKELPYSWRINVYVDKVLPYSWSIYQSVERPLVYSWRVMRWYISSRVLFHFRSKKRQKTFQRPPYNRDFE